MKCPLFQLASIAEDRVLPSPQADCLKEECAWWADEYKCCAIHRITMSIDDLVDEVEQINAGIRLVK